MSEKHVTNNPVSRKLASDTTTEGRFMIRTANESEVKQCDAINQAAEGISLDFGSAGQPVAVEMIDPCLLQVASAYSAGTALISDAQGRGTIVPASAGTYNVRAFTLNKSTAANDFVSVQPVKQLFKQ